MSMIDDKVVGVLPTKYTITLFNLLENATYLTTFNNILSKLNTLFDTDIIKDIQGDTSFIELFKATYNQEEINGETIPIWFMRLESKAVKCYNMYFQLVQAYYKDIELYDGEVSTRVLNENVEQSGQNAYQNQNINYELPNKVTEKEYPSSKQNGTGSYNESNTNDRTFNERTTKSNIVKQRNLIMNSLKNVMQDAIYYFRDDFLYIY